MTDLELFAEYVETLDPSIYKDFYTQIMEPTGLAPMDFCELTEPKTIACWTWFQTRPINYQRNFWSWNDSKQTPEGRL